jgi:type III restriction enzyme
METGTGKTYVYLRTIFELSRRYGFQKFIIVVPSVAIREGVLKNIEITAEHFRALYNNLPFEHFVYDARKVNRLR